MDLEHFIIVRALEGSISHPDLCQRTQSGRQIEVDFVTRIGETEIDVLALVDQPPPLLCGREVSEFDVVHRSATISAACAMGQYWPYPFMLVEATSGTSEWPYTFCT